MRLSTTAARPAANGAAGLPRLGDFAKRALALALNKVGGTPDQRHAAAYAEKRWGAGAGRQLFEQHAAVPGHTTTGEYGSELTGDSVTAQFTNAWRQRALLPQLPNAIDAPVKTRLVNLGARPSFGVVTEGAAIPVNVLDIDGTALAYIKAAGIVASSKELLAAPGAERWLARALLSGDVLASDTAFLSTTTGVLASVSALHYSASDVDDIIFAVKLLLDTLVDPDWNSVTLVCPPAVAIALSLIRDTNGGAAFPGVSVKGGELAGLPLFVTAGCPSQVLAAIDGSGIARNTAGRLEVRSSDAADLEMRTVTTTNLTAPAAAQLLSLFQSDTVAFRFVHEIAFSQVRPGSVAYLSGFNPGAEIVT